MKVVHKTLLYAALMLFSSSAEASPNRLHIQVQTNAGSTTISLVGHLNLYQVEDYSELLHTFKTQAAIESSDNASPLVFLKGAISKEGEAHIQIHLEDSTELVSMATNTQYNISTIRIRGATAQSVWNLLKLETSPENALRGKFSSHGAINCFYADLIPLFCDFDIDHPSENFTFNLED